MKALVGSGIDSNEWNRIQAELRDRAFFSAKVMETRLLKEMRGGVAGSLAGNLSASEFRRNIREALSQSGYRRPSDGAAGTIQDLMTKQRLDLVYRTNREMAQGYIQHLSATSAGALEAYPAYELIRAERRKSPRDWHRIWTSKGGKLYGNGRMIALKTDEIWTRISRFGLTYAPFDYNSGMDLVAVARSECLRLGVITAQTPPQKPVKRGFNEGLTAEINGLRSDSEEGQYLLKTFGDQISIKNSKVNWVGNLIQDVVHGKREKACLGKATQTFLELASQVLPKADVEKLSRMNPSFNKAVFFGHAIKHFGEYEKRLKDNIPLTMADCELISTAWRTPDRLIPISKRQHIVICELQTFDGGYLNFAVHSYRGFASVYKTKYPLEATVENALYSQQSHVDSIGPQAVLGQRTITMIPNHGERVNNV